MATALEMASKARLEAIRAKQQFAQARTAVETAAPTDEKKMGMFIFLFTLSIAVLADLAPLLDAGTLTLFLTIPADLLLLLLIGLDKGGRKQIKKMLTAAFGEAVPVVNVLPLRTVMLVYAYVKSNPKVVQSLGTVAKIAGYIPTPQTQALARGFQVASRVSETAARPSRGFPVRQEAA